MNTLGVQMPCKPCQPHGQAVQALCKGCANSTSAVQGVQLASGLAIQSCMGQEFVGMGFSWDGVLGVPSMSLHSVCVHTEQSRWLALKTCSQCGDRTPVKLQQKEIQEAAVTNAREKRLFRGEKKKKQCLFWRNTYIPSNKSSQCLFLYLWRNRNRHNQGLKRLEITS